MVLLAVGESRPEGFLRAKDARVVDGAGQDTPEAVARLAEFRKVVDGGEAASREVAAKGLFALAENLKAANGRFNSNATQALIPHPAPAAEPVASPARFRVLALAEAGGHHLAFTEAAKPWLQQCGKENGFEVDYLSNTAPITAEYLARYRLVLQLDFVPYGWTPEARTAFKAYIEQGLGGWVGLHHATLLGDFDGQPMWSWFSEFMGGIKYRDYIATFASATVRVEDRRHPCLQGVPEAFVVPKEEWYTYDRSPRGKVRVLASVDETTYAPASVPKMGDHPVVWTNEQVPARNVYLFMGHGPDLLENPAYTTLLRNAILWAAGK